MDFDDEIIKDFLTECNEHLDSLDNGFIAIEQDHSNREILSAIFRSLHTIKGGAGMLALNKLERLTHAAESLLSLLRDGKLILTQEMTTALLKTVDSVRSMLACISQTGQDGQEEYIDLIKELETLQIASDSPISINVQQHECAEAVGTADVETRNTDNPHMSEEVETEATDIKAESIRIEDPGKDNVDQSPVLNQSALEESVHCPETNISSVPENTIRIPVELLDKLMNLVGELVLSRNQILQLISSQSVSNIITVSQRLNLITSELQEGVMKTRMQPIGNVWGKLPRVVRDLARTCNKKVIVEMIGKETELDKTLIEAIKDPLTHIVRNSVDHGIETPEQRLAAGKPEEGRLTLRAFHEGGHVNIEIADDGAGISPDKIKEKALARGLITVEQMTRLTEHDAINLIFLPGFSTAEQVTNVSGRGVGMDVVRTNIEKINGTVEVKSVEGHSTTLKIKIPLTLAIIPALIVTSHHNRYAIPQVNLLELVRLDIEQIKRDIHWVNDTPIYRLRGKLLPLIYLDKELEIDSELKMNEQCDCVNIIVLQAGETQFGLIVDQINDTQEIVVKPLNKLLKNIICFAGATIMGDGKISLILDVMGLAKKSGILQQDVLSSNLINYNHLQSKETNKNILLLITLNQGNLVAVPLDKVNRIEEFLTTSIEKAGNMEVVQYRQSILPLVRLSLCVNHSADCLIAQDKILVVVCTQNSKHFGLIVEHIFDIVEGDIQLNTEINRAGVAGTTVIENKVTEILDVDQFIHMALPHYFITKESHPNE